MHAENNITLTIPKGGCPTPAVPTRPACAALRLFCAARRGRRRTGKPSEHCPFEPTHHDSYVALHGSRECIRAECIYRFHHVEAVSHPAKGRVGLEAQGLETPPMPSRAAQGWRSDTQLIARYRRAYVPNTTNLPSKCGAGATVMKKSTALVLAPPLAMPSR